MKFKHIVVTLLIIIPTFCLAEKVRRIVLLPPHAGDVIILKSGQPSVIKWEEDGRHIDYMHLPERKCVVSISMEGDPGEPDYYLITHDTEGSSETKRLKIKTSENMTISEILDVSKDGSAMIAKVAIKKKTESENITQQMYGLIEIETGNITPIKF
jgi:hypothetical protein